MERGPRVARSAFRHDVLLEDIVHAFDHPMFTVDLDEGLLMIIGPSRAAALLELGLIVGSDGPVIVHAMPAGPQFLRRK